MGLRPGAVIAVERPDVSAPVERGVAPLPKRREPIMSLETAQRYAWNLACTLKVIIILIETDDGYAAMASDDYDGDADHVVREYDVFAQ
ncbi:hypothetical protein [Sphingomonas nostoxanthinifaciens]|uniref:hypothetical protein n=1 Tax=Sphingomonas nostoxanthinifaciens TaxID=2872652 RepID=UPI001CC1FDE5|nr:hypothetical protein [Sphingomonas nostoxanthinifaciens]UAK26808.1 hypothetical protein K8P63_03725 [Sphingomonas nostoxanthinifaciens]